MVAWLRTAFQPAFWSFSNVASRETVTSACSTPSFVFREGFRTATRQRPRGSNRGQAIRIQEQTFCTSQTWTRPRIHGDSQAGFQASRGQARRCYGNPYTRRSSFNYQKYQGGRSLLARWAARPTFYYEVGGIAAACGGFYVYNLERVPVSGRSRFNVISPELEIQLAGSQYQQTMQEYGGRIMGPHTYEHRLVQRVLDRLIPHSGLENEQWEIHVIDADDKNAFVIPGGKVFVFRGILEICAGEDGLAAVLGHEIAHNVAHHAAERISQGCIFAPLALLGALALQVDPQLLQMGISLAFTLPGSRTNESEADYIGLLMMAASCYDPAAAMGLWARMEAAEKNAPPQFLSTHPSNHNRLEKIREWLPQAQERWQQSDCHAMGGNVREFRDRFPCVHAAQPFPSNDESSYVSVSLSRVRVDDSPGQICIEPKGARTMPGLLFNVSSIFGVQGPGKFPSGDPCGATAGVVVGREGSTRSLTLCLMGI
nr:mitochondrial metalloendopeptidase oma1 [Quercus suber]